MNKKIKYSAFLLLAACAGLFLYNKYRVAPGLDFSKLSLVNMDGQPAEMETFRGKKIILSFGATWCGNCLSEMKTLNSIKESELQDVEIVCISDEPLEKIRNFAELKGYPFTFLKLLEPFSQHGINALPTNYILNNKLEVKYEKVGEIDWKDASTVAHIKKLME